LLTVGSAVEAAIVVVFVCIHRRGPFSHTYSGILLKRDEFDSLPTDCTAISESGGWNNVLVVRTAKDPYLYSYPHGRGRWWSVVKFENLPPTNARESLKVSLSGTEIPFIQGSRRRRTRTLQFVVVTLPCRCSETRCRTIATVSALACGRKNPGENQDGWQQQQEIHRY
jgi:hypothetical protein